MKYCFSFVAVEIDLKGVRIEKYSQLLGLGQL